MEVKSMLKIPKNIARDTRLSSGSRLIYGELMDFGEISVDELAVIYKISKKTLTRRINQLVKYGYIQYEYICKKRPKLMIIKSGQNCPYGMGKDVQKEEQKEDSKKEFVEKEREEKRSKKEEKELNINKYIYYINNPNKTKYINKLSRKKKYISSSKESKKKSNEKVKMEDGKIESGIGDQNVNSDYEHGNDPNFDENASKVKLHSEEKKIEKNGVRIKKKEMELINLVNQYTKNTDLVLSILEFIRMRSVIKKPLTKYALEISLRHLDSLSTDDETKKQIVDRSIQKNWLSFYPLPSPDWKTKENNDHNAYVIE
jgi:hypothetical protein